MLFGKKGKSKTDTERCQVRDDGEYCVVALSGEVDLSWSAEIRQALLGGLGARRPVLVELSLVTYIDSSGIASFVEAYQESRSRKLQFGLVAASKPVLAALRLSRLDSVFPLHADIPAARGARKG
jgi:anti-sigma B factor antagonist